MNDTKKIKRELYLRQTINAIFLAGIIILFIGVYYWIIKAGIPYQDPPLELQIQQLDECIKPYLSCRHWFPICYIHDPDFIYYVTPNITEALK